MPLSSPTRLVLVLVLALAAAHAVHAHYVLTAPPTRLLDESLMVQPPCGGASDVKQPRTPWVPGTDLTINAFHTNAAFSVYVTLNDKPAAVKDFVKILDTNVAKLGNQTVAAPLDKLDAGALASLGLKSSTDLIGKSGTIMTTYDAGDGVLYQCGDVTFVQAGAASGGSDKTKSAAAPGAGRSAAVAAVVGAVLVSVVGALVL
ncbi:hypothetical protein AMAG_00169 [Allomyces macrogynus ATCC 38327]|uniref:Copper acquisition factor BIM1-like domain-containing protein n=1 Tax=Allomyces macrogynus (strain ATCC 38327) TaxID=578462 RepID=A0A0L0RV43_ALLM3|nr:hypothetical protein AMAG_00169 [Allomyces macrogynus ATCC 38327]|eukprot:KNE54173.1 hypothetical protein AMAG_00169 [Allomyces macrogynus ATCC 38327]